MEVISFDRENVFWEVVNDHIAEGGNDSDYIVLQV